MSVEVITRCDSRCMHPATIHNPLIRCLCCEGNIKHGYRNAYRCSPFCTNAIAVMSTVGNCDERKCTKNWCDQQRDERSRRFLEFPTKVHYKFSEAVLPFDYNICEYSTADDRADFLMGEQHKLDLQAEVVQCQLHQVNDPRWRHGGELEWGHPGHPVYCARCPKRCCHNQYAHCWGCGHYHSKRRTPFSGDVVCDGGFAIHKPL